MSDSLTIKEAADLAGESPAVVYWWARAHPEYFIFRQTGLCRKTAITREQLEALMAMRKCMAPKPRRPYKPRRFSVPPPPEQAKPPTPPTVSVQPSQVSREGEVVAYLCTRCDDVRPLQHRLCRCLDGVERPELIAKFKAAHWLPATVRRTVTLGNALPLSKKGTP